MVILETASDDAIVEEIAMKPTAREGQYRNSDEEVDSHMRNPDVDRGGEGWETASEGDHEDDDPSVAAHTEERYEDAMTEEEQRQRYIAQANDAKAEGNRLYGIGQYEEALAEYGNALELAPDHPIANEIRSMCYANRAICYYKMCKYEDTVKESTKALELNPTYMKALIRRAEAHERLEHFEEAIADMKKVLELDAFNEQAKRTIIRLEPLAAEKREKLKEEMIDSGQEVTELPILP